MWSSSHTRRGDWFRQYSGNGHSILDGKRRNGCPTFQRIKFVLCSGLDGSTEARRISNTSFSPTGQTKSVFLALIFCVSLSMDQTVGVWPTNALIGTARPSANKTRVSPVTHSLRSADCGRLLPPAPPPHGSAQTGDDGHPEFLRERQLSAREMPAISCSRLVLDLPSLAPDINWR